MKTIGMIGGLAWPSTVDYYRGLCERTNALFKAQGGDAPYPTPHILLESLNITEVRKLRGIEGDEASWGAYDQLLRDSFMRLSEAGAAFGFIASNTPHMRLHAITRDLGFPVVSILDSTAAAAAAMGATHAMMLGTPITMRSSVYAETLQGYGIQPLSRPNEADIALLGRMIDEDLYQNEIEAPRAALLELAARAVEKVPDAVVCLACTELPLAFPEHRGAVSFEVGGIRFVNTVAAHLDAVLQAAIQ